LTEKTVKVMISYVGMRDPFAQDNNQAGPVLTVAESIRPDVVFLLPTSQMGNARSSTEENAWKTKEYLDILDWRPKVSVLPLLIRDAANVQDVLTVTKSELRRVLDVLQSDGVPFELHLNVSSGTPQMQQTLLVLAHSGFFPAPTSLWQALDPRLAVGDRVRSVTTHFLEEENILHAIRKYADQYAFGVIALEFKRLAEISAFQARRSLAEEFQRLFLAYAAWDHLHYRHALDRLRSVWRRFQGTEAKDLDAAFAEQAAFLERLCREPTETVPVLVDLYYNADRAFARQAYADALARFWRLYEGALRLWIREVYGIDPDRFRLSALQSSREDVRRWAAEAYRQGAVRAADVSVGNHVAVRSGDGGEHAAGEGYAKLWEMVRFLEEIGDQHFRQLAEQDVDVPTTGAPTKKKLGILLEELRRKRNVSIVAHGLEPVERLDAERALVAGRTLISALFEEGARLLEHYPLTRERLEEVFEWIGRS